MNHLQERDWFNLEERGKTYIAIEEVDRIFLVGLDYLSSPARRFGGTLTVRVARVSPPFGLLAGYFRIILNSCNVWFT